MSRRICDFIAASFGLAASELSTFCLRASSRETSARFCSACSAFSASSLRLASTSPSFTWPVVRERSVPPPRSTCDESPEPEPPISDTRSGELKKSAMPFLSPSVVEPSSHISRKNAIMAVTKSAYAIFHAPPWWPWLAFLIRLMMIG